MRTGRVQLLWERLFAVALILSLSAFAVAVVYSPTWASPIALGAVLGMWVLSLLSRRPIWACLGYVALIPLEYVGGLPFGGLSVTKVAGVLAVLTTLAWFVISRRPFGVPWVAIPVGVLIVAFVASWWLGARSSFGAELLFTLVTVVATSLVLTNMLFSRKEWRLLLLTLASSTCACAVIALLYALRTGLLRVDNVGVINRLRHQFLLANPNYLALSLSLGLLASLALLYLDLPRVVKGWVGLCAMVTACGVVATLSRSGLLVTALGAGFLVLQLSGRQGRWRQLVTWGGVVVAVSLIVGGVALRSRILAFSQDISVAGRLWALQAGWGMWLDHPIVGIGLGRFADSFLMYAPPSRYYIEYTVAHNSWMEILAETGLLGFMAWCSVAIVTAREWFSSSHGIGDREGRVIGAFVGAALLALFLASLVLTIHFRKFPWLFIFLAFRIRAVLGESVAEGIESRHDNITTIVLGISKERLRSSRPWIVGVAGVIVILAVLIGLSPLPERFYLNYMATPTLTAAPTLPEVTPTVIAAPAVIIIRQEAEGGFLTEPMRTPTVIAAPAVIIIRQEAEGGFLTEPMRKVLDTDSSSGFYIHSQEGSGDHSQGQVTFSINIPRSGSYLLWGRVRGPDTCSNSFYVSVDESDEVVWNFNVGDWHWAGVTDGQGAPQAWNLDKGKHTVTFRTRGDGAQLDVVEMVSAGPLAE